MFQSGGLPYLASPPWACWHIEVVQFVAPETGEIEGGNALSRLSVSRLAPLSPRCLGCDHRDRLALGPRPCPIRSLCHCSSVCVRTGARMVSLGDLLHHPDHAAARPDQFWRRARNLLDVQCL